MTWADDRLDLLRELAEIEQGFLCIAARDGVDLSADYQRIARCRAVIVAQLTNQPDVVNLISEWTPRLLH